MFLAVGCCFLLALLEYNNRNEKGIIYLIYSIESQIRNVCQGGNTMLAKVDELVVKLSSINKILQVSLPQEEEQSTGFTTVRTVF